MESNANPQAEEVSRLIAEAEKYENCVYIEAENIPKGDPAAFHIGEKTGVIRPTKHIGMSANSILFLSSEPGDPDGVDLRYFPKWDGFRTYRWSDTIEKLVIKNKTEKPICVNEESIAPGETKIIENPQKKTCQEQTAENGIIST